eukprot:ctg_1690.g665
MVQSGRRVFGRACVAFREGAAVVRDRRWVVERARCSVLRGSGGSSRARARVPRESAGRPPTRTDGWWGGVRCRARGPASQLWRPTESGRSAW